MDTVISVNYGMFIPILAESDVVIRKKHRYWLDGNGKKKFQRGILNKNDNVVLEKKINVSYSLC